MKRSIIIAVLTLALLCAGTSLAETRAAARVSYLGLADTYTEEAVQFFFQGGEALNPKETVNDAIAGLLPGEADFAVIPRKTP